MGVAGGPQRSWPSCAATPIAAALPGPILDMPEQAIDKILEINVKSAILLCQEVRPHLQRGAAILFISSYTAFNPSNPIPMYAGKYCALPWPGSLLPP